MLSLALTDVIILIVIALADFILGLFLGILITRRLQSRPVPQNTTVTDTITEFEQRMNHPTIENPVTATPKNETTEVNNGGPNRRYSRYGYYNRY
ncbi:MAG: hypothetical protein K0S76_389 [Herbinix sp.]|jgi:uncharacterized protein YneF (UPF0154 family)|nr:hypothetical protein [Herbinix sp.]